MISEEKQPVSEAQEGQKLRLSSFIFLSLWQKPEV